MGLALSLGVLAGCTGKSEPGIPQGSRRGRSGWSPSTPATRHWPDCGRRPRPSSGRTASVAATRHRQHRGVASAARAANAQGGAAADSAPSSAEKSTTHSGTNSHEAGVDEPDLVKTDGHRIVTVAGGVLRVVDAASSGWSARST